MLIELFEVNERPSRRITTQFYQILFKQFWLLSEETIRQSGRAVVVKLICSILC